MRARSGAAIVGLLLALPVAAAADSGGAADDPGEEEEREEERASTEEQGGVASASGDAAEPPGTGAAAPGPGADGWGEVFAGAGGSFSSGEYGSSDTIDIWTAHVELAYAYRRFEVSVTVPYLRVDGAGRAVPGGGGVIPDDVDGVAPDPASSRPGPGGADEDESEHGLGDLRIEARARLVEDGAWAGPALDLLVDVKAPTADEDEGLGTGEWDGGVGVASSYRLDRWVFLADLRLLAVGEPDGADFAPVTFLYELSAGYSAPTWERGSLTPFVFLGGQTPVAEGADPPFELGVGAFVVHGRLEGSLTLSVGLTDGSPDIELAFALGYRWGAPTS